MAKANQYGWLIVVEGNSDVETYEQLLIKYGVQKTAVKLFPARYKSNVCNADTWGTREYKGAMLLDTIKTDIARSNFSGILLVVDSDENAASAFKDYKRNPSIPYVSADVLAATLETNNFCWRLDTINGASVIPVLGLSVPYGGAGCLESDLLSAFGFPVDGQTEYDSFVDIVKAVSAAWKIPKHKDGKDWWEVNRKAKLDKFVYSSLSYGFRVCHENPDIPNLPEEPDVIKKIKAIIQRHN